MPKYQEISTVLIRRQLAPSFFLLTLHAPKIAACAAPGQFVMAAVSSNQDPFLRRPISLYDCNREDGAVQLLIKPVGRGTSALVKSEPGQHIDLLGPLGQGFQVVSGGPVALVGGGVGIAPLYLLARVLIESGTAPEQCLVLLGAQTGADLHSLASSFQALGCPTRIATDDGSAGYHGRVGELLPKHLREVRQVYACGPWPMMADIALQCADAATPCQVSLETHMGCGIGACLGCTVHDSGGGYLHVCKTGPVVDATKVRWQP
ncbi:MAG: dihydroorotate dehydrogenase electron transfer subunit [Desulfobulbus sp.]|jgi:dihydroorotate dehydrogenase electron transfer subunit